MTTNSTPKLTWWSTAVHVHWFLVNSIETTHSLSCNSFHLLEKTFPLNYVLYMNWIVSKREGPKLMYHVTVHSLVFGGWHYDDKYVGRCCTGDSQFEFHNWVWKFLKNHDECVQSKKYVFDSQEQKERFKRSIQLLVKLRSFRRPWGFCQSWQKPKTVSFLQILLLWQGQCVRSAPEK